VNTLIQVEAVSFIVHDVVLIPLFTMAVVYYLGKRVVIDKC
jgi:hypothetical protein